MSQELETIAITTYKNNLLYFEQSQPSIYSKLAAFDAALEEGHYESKYDLILKENYFDVLELSSGNYLYDSSSIDYATTAKESINYDKNANLFKTFKNITIKDEDLTKYEKLSIIQNNLSGLAPILHYCSSHMPKDETLSNISKFIFFGTGLGTHISEIHRKINAQTYLIVEDDLELFKLSLFVTPYNDIAKNSTLIFSLFDSKKEFSQPVLEFLNKDFYHNHYIKYFQMLNQSDEKLKEFHQKIASQSHNLFYYATILEQYLKPLEYLQDGYNFVNLLELPKSSLLKSKPLLLIAAGPSLQKNMQWLKKNHHKFVVVALSAVLCILEEEHIVPDIVTHIDGLEESIVHFSKLKSLEFLKETTLLLSARTPSEIIKLLEKKHIFFFENGTHYKENFGNLMAPCVGSTSYLLLLALGVQEMYLLGLDLALDAKSGSTHAIGHHYSQELDLTLKDEDIMKFKESVTQTVGNFCKSVYTTPEFLLSIASINSTSTSFKQNNQNVYNLNDGAMFLNTIPLNLESNDLTLPTIDKYKLRQDFISTFTKYSSVKLTVNELSSLHLRLKYADLLHHKILLQREKSFHSNKLFLDSLIVLFKELASSADEIHYDISIIFQEYFKLIYTFIFDFFNTTPINTSSLHQNTINQLLCTQLLKIISIYQDKLKQAINKDS